MSSYEDIATGYKRLKTTGDYGLIYTCNCGWVDLGHAFASSKDPTESAANLWTQIRAGGPDAKTGRMTCYKYTCGYPTPIGARNYGYQNKALWQMRQDGIARFPDGRTGFRVTTSQKMRVPFFGGKVGSTKSFLIRHNLTEAQKKSIALSIFLIVSQSFERFQYMLEFGGVANFAMQQLAGRPYDSGYSHEDLVSNLIGFYVAVGELTKAEALEICHPVSEATARKIWWTDGPVGSSKNQSFSPAFPPSTLMCTVENPNGYGDCAGQPQRFPEAFRQIKEAPIGQNFIPLAEV